MENKPDQKRIHGFVVDELFHPSIPFLIDELSVAPYFSMIYKMVSYKELIFYRYEPTLKSRQH